MSDLEARIAEVSKAHRPFWNEVEDEKLHCMCGHYTVPNGDAATTAWGDHIAAMLAPVIREREAEAWDDGHDDGENYGYRLYQYERGYVDTLPDPINPYRRSNDE